MKREVKNEGCRFKTAMAAMLALAVALGCGTAEAAKKGPAKKGPAKKAAVAKAPGAKAAPAKPVETAHRKTPYVGAISADAKTGRVLFAANADAEAYPASVTKLMTLLLVLEDVKAGKYQFADRVKATADVYRCEPSWVGIKVDEEMSVEDLLTALMVESANDAAIALGVKSAGSIAGFVARMNARAAQLGMTRTKYYNPNGLPPNPAKRYPWKSFNVSTANDQLKLALALLKLPDTLRFTSIKTCDLVKTSYGYRTSVTRRVNASLAETKLAEGESIVKQMRNHNNVMVKDKLKIHNPDGREAVDGLKTGYIDAGGSSVIVTAARGNTRVIAVVLGSQTAKDRDTAVAKLVSDALGAIAW